MILDWLTRLAAIMARLIALLALDWLSSWHSIDCRHDTRLTDHGRHQNLTLTLTLTLALTLTLTLALTLTLSLIHISEPTRLLSISYAVFCLKKKKKKIIINKKIRIKKSYKT
eukprot:TRINITY_DN13300_c0_g2_i4.p1 TRINITY_DN13300_c0_g2~~TRINITY_DN13300_c0_g2_i4.p1  ORF type:complete len:113 (-),score=22.90 TRINITY_DN13300_c0_g2_i4:13-351(-)